MSVVALWRSLTHRSHAADWALVAGGLGALSVRVFAFVYHSFVAALAPAVLVTVAATAARREA